MYCNKCGREIEDDAVMCKYCCNFITKQQTTTAYYGESKTVIGVVLALFLSLLGLIIGLCLYPYMSYERETFMRGWGITMLVVIIAAVVISFGSCLLIFI